jgi:hypothetical protein
VRPARLELATSWFVDRSGRLDSMVSLGLARFRMVGVGWSGGNCPLHCSDVAQLKRTRRACSYALMSDRMAIHVSFFYGSLAVDGPRFA